jgi:phosphohistidine phosphatase
MKTITFIRHAKSDWNIEGLADIDRALNARGYKDAHEMAARLMSKKIMLDEIVTSPAIRAISTALIFARLLQITTHKLLINEQLYDTSLESYLQVIASLSNSKHSILIFGHNPIITQTANYLTPPFTENIPTCGMACIAFDCEDWKLVKKQKGKLLFYDFPKNENSLT